MPRYFFDVQSRSGLVCQDFHGLECRNDAAALAVARHGAGFTSHDDCTRNPQLTSYRFAVTDAEHRPLFTVPFTELEPDAPAKPRRPRAPRA
ncbi:hypothetical protein OPKNFCMD_5769 [Methylobacterium crusticola]|uniref:DUF6894 domain-containing protein n=1 Tax=Methylobacterium crusticola TaxID=1697972 RepID=A0ABQ4R869_9HYPH|nr:hypothetical protein [Methylobacterium crusticola]GJD52999.1 hypothetical protein OPKNFCMD_5769 [Methylobacterium crusticola]